MPPLIADTHQTVNRGHPSNPELWPQPILEHRITDYLKLVSLLVNAYLHIVGVTY